MRAAVRLLATLFFSLVILYLGSPILLMLVSSFGGGLYLEFPPPSFSLEWYVGFFRTPAWRTALNTSLQLGLVVAVFSVTLAGMAAYWIARKQFRGKVGLTTFFLLPAMMPVIVYTVAFYVLFAANRFLNNWLLLLIAHTVLGFPYAFLIIQVGVAGLDQDIEDAARTLGATGAHRLRFIILPLLKWHLLFAAISVFVVSFTEPVTAIFLTSGDIITLPKKTWEGLRYGIDPRTVVGTAILVYAILGGVALTAAMRLRRRLPQQ